MQAAINAARADLPTSLQAEPDLSQGQSGRRADHGAGADLDARGRPASSTTSPPTSCSSDCRSLTGIGEVDVTGSALPARAGRAEPDGAVPLRHRPRGRARRARLGQRQQPEGRRSRTTISTIRSTPTIRRRKAAQYRDLVDRLSQQRRGQAAATSPRSSIRSRICATPASPTASRRSASCCRASRAPTSFRPSTT